MAFDKPGATSGGGVPAPTFTAEARRSAADWKRRTLTLESEERADAPYRGRGRSYPFCIPIEAARKNLLPDAREAGLDRFAAGNIEWHDEIDGGPSNHLLSSQVQCVNALAPLVDRPGALAGMFGDVLPIHEILPFGAETTNRFDHDDHVVFEWIGLRDYLGERKGGRGGRGTHCTSADAAIRYVTDRGDEEIALIEWKYTEQYLGHELDGDSAYMRTRMDRYRSLWLDPEGPLRKNRIPYDDLFVEPFYQLMRLQFLASEMEKHEEVGANAVRLIVVAPSRNRELARSFNRTDQRTLGGLSSCSTIWESWSAMQARPSRFVVLDSAALVDAGAPPSAEFKDRYGHLAGA